jgi:hypothetical protein
MADRSKRSNQQTYEDSRSVTSSPESVGGRTPSSLQSGGTVRSGQAAARASRSAQPVVAPASTMTDTSGQSGHGSSASAALQQSLESRLRERLDGAGSTLYRLTWKQKATPSGRPYCQLAASAPRTRENACGSWRSPDANQRGGAYQDPAKVSQRIARGHQINLEDQACLATWPTASSRDGKGGYQGGRIRHGTISTDTLDVAAQLSPWPTVTEADSRGSGSRNALGSKAHQGVSLSDLVKTGDSRGRQPLGSRAETARSVSLQLNPRFSLWLMGYPTAWAHCAELVTR